MRWAAFQLVEWWYEVSTPWPFNPVVDATCSARAAHAALGSCEPGRAASPPCASVPRAGEVSSPARSPRSRVRPRPAPALCRRCYGCLVVLPLADIPPALRGLFSIDSVSEQDSHQESLFAFGERIADPAPSVLVARPKSERRAAFAVTGSWSRERLAAPVAENRDAQTCSQGTNW